MYIGVQTVYNELSSMDDSAGNELLLSHNDAAVPREVSRIYGLKILNLL